MTGIVPIFPGAVAQEPATAESIIAQVRRELVADGAGATGRQTADLDLLAETAVRTLWGGRVTAFVPVLALRDAREELRGRGSDHGEGATELPDARHRSTHLEGD